MDVTRRQFIKIFSLAGVPLNPRISPSSQSDSQKQPEYRLEILVKAEGKLKDRFSLNGTVDYLREKFNEMLIKEEVPDLRYMDSGLGAIATALLSDPHYANNLDVFVGTNDTILRNRILKDMVSVNDIPEIVIIAESEITEDGFVKIKGIRQYGSASPYPRPIGHFGYRFYRLGDTFSEVWELRSPSANRNFSESYLEVELKSKDMGKIDIVGLRDWFLRGLQAQKYLKK